MATDKYNIQYSVLTIIQKGYQYALALMKYRAQKARQEAEMKFYERIYGRAVKNPDSVRIAYTQDDLTPQALKELCAERGIPVETDPYGHNFVIYDVRYESRIMEIVYEAERKEQKLFQENHFHETQYGYQCYYSGEYIPYMDPETGSFIDQDGRLHKGDWSGELDDDEIIERIEKRKFNPNAVWNRDSEGRLVNEFGEILYPEDYDFTKDETFQEMDTDGETTSHEDAWKSADRTGPVYTRCPGGYRSEHDFIKNCNEYGDYYSPQDKRVHLNYASRDNEEARIQRLLASEVNPVNTGHRFVKAKDGSLVNLDSGTVVFLHDEDGYKFPVRESFYEAEKSMEAEAELEKELGEERLPEGFNEEQDAETPDSMEVNEDGTREEGSECGGTAILTDGAEEPASEKKWDSYKHKTAEDHVDDYHEAGYGEGSYYDEPVHDETVPAGAADSSPSNSGISYENEQVQENYPYEPYQESTSANTDYTQQEQAAFPNQEKGYQESRTEWSYQENRDYQTAHGQQDYKEAASYQEASDPYAEKSISGEPITENRESTTLAGAGSASGAYPGTADNGYKAEVSSESSQYSSQGRRQDNGEPASSSTSDSYSQRRAEENAATAEKAEAAAKGSEWGKQQYSGSYGNTNRDSYDRQPAHSGSYTGTAAAYTAGKAAYEHSTSFNTVHAPAMEQPQKDKHPTEKDYASAIAQARPSELDYQPRHASRGERTEAGARSLNANAARPSGDNSHVFAHTQMGSGFSSNERPGSSAGSYGSSASSRTTGTPKKEEARELRHDFAKMNRQTVEAGAGHGYSKATQSTEGGATHGFTKGPASASHEGAKSTPDFRRGTLGKSSKPNGMDALKEKASKYGYQHMTAQKKYGFQAINPGKQLQAVKPSAAGLIGAFGGAYRMIVTGADRESKVQVARYVRPIGAVYNMIGGVSVYKNAVKTTEEMLSTLNASGNLRSLNNILSANGHKTISSVTHANIKDLNSSLVRLGQRAGVIKRQGSMFFYNHDKIALFRMGATTDTEAAILGNALKNAASFQNGAGMFKRGFHVAYMTLRMAVMNSDDRTMGYVFQGMDTVRVFRQFGKSSKEAWNSRLLNKPLKEQAGKAAGRTASQTASKTASRVASKTAGRVRTANFRTDPFRPTKMGNIIRPSDNLKKNAKAVRKYTELRKKQAASRLNSVGSRLRNSERIKAVADLKLKTVQAHSKFGTVMKNKFSQPYNRFKGRVMNTNMGKRIAASRKAAAAKQAKKAAAKSALKRAGQKQISAFFEAVSKTVNALLHKLMIILGIYVLACIGIMTVATIVIVPAMFLMSAETDDTSLDGNVAMEDVYDKSHTMTGIIYNELRFMEVEWGSQLRSYGTEETPLALSELNFTEYNVSARQYVLSQTGSDDLLGTWAYDSSKEGILSDKMFEGVLGPEPFDGAAPQDHKLLRDIDGGNTLELRGKPQEGYTSNAKQITAMASVFYSQTLDTLNEEANEAKGLAKFASIMKRLWKAAWTFFEKEEVPILGWVGKHTGWSWTSVYRNYAYPLMEASHQENFYLSSYIYPTKFSYGATGARWDGAKGGNPDENGDQTVKIDQKTGQEAKNGRIGIVTEGGSGKVTSDFKVSNETYQGQGDEDWQSIEMCPADMYNGYGCTARNSFGYKYNGHFATDKDLNVTHADELASLYYGSDPDEESEFSNVSNVSADVSPWDTDEENEQGYNRDSCIINILQLTDKASECWTLESRDSLTGYNFEEETDLLQATFHSGRMNDEYLNRGFDLEEDLTIQKVEETEDGCDVYVSYPFSEEIVLDGDGEPIRDPDTGEYEMRTVYTGDGFILHFKHTCQMNHEGYYCGGHLQLRTRGIVYGFSEEQSYAGVSEEEGTISAFAPKFLDPINYEDPNFIEGAENRLPNDSDATEEEREAYPDLHVWNVDELSLTGDDKTPQILEEDLATLYRAEDIFDIDSVIQRERDNYPGYSSNSKLESFFSGTGTTALSKWTGWTYTNMSQAVSLTYSDWFETYALADTQTAVGGIYDNTAAGLNNLSVGVVEKIQELLIGENEYLNLNADLDDPEATNMDGSIMTEEDKELVDRIRHVMYALSAVGEVSYSQSAHANMYGNVKGNATDCSGFVCNIYRDRMDATYTVNGLYNNGIVTPREYHGIGTSGIEPGDIILVNPESPDGEAHALIYVGTFNTADLYGDSEGSGEERVFNVDCSSMVFNLNDLASQEDTPVKSMYKDEDGNRLSLSDGYGDSQVEDVPKVRSGNVRFADREYMNTDTDNMYYLDMSEWERVAGRQLNGDYSELGDTAESFWESSAIATDLTQVRQEVDIKFPDVSNDSLTDPVVDIEIPEEDWKPEIEDPEDPIVEGKKVVLQMNQFILQGNQPWSGLVRGSISGNSTIGKAGCTDCSYLMAVSYYTGISFDVGDMLSQSKYYDGNAFNSGVLLSEYGLSQSRYSGYDVNAIRDAIDNGSPVILQIDGWFSFHQRDTGHFMVIMGYDDEGFMMYDPASTDNSYNYSGRSIPYEAFTRGPGDIVSYRVITN